MAYVTKAELIEQAKASGATDEQLKGLNRDEVAELLESLTEVEGDGATQEEVAEDHGVAEEATDDSAVDASAEDGTAEVADSDTATDGDLTEGVEDESTEETADDSSEAEDGSEATAGDPVSETTEVVDESEDDPPVLGDDPAPVELEKQEATQVDTPVDVDAEVEGAAGVDNIPESEVSGDDSDEDDPLESIDPSAEPVDPIAREGSEFRTAMPTVFTIADAALDAADYELSDDIVAAIACDLIGLCGRARRAAAVIRAGVKIPRSFGGRLRFNATKRAMHGMLGSFESNARISQIVRELTDCVSGMEPEDVVKAVREVEAYIGEEPHPGEDKTNTPVTTNEPQEVVSEGEEATESTEGE